MHFSLKTLLMQSLLVSTAFGLIFVYGEGRYGALAFIAVSALYSACFALFYSRSASIRNGIAGAVLGWVVALSFAIAPGFFHYVVPNGIDPDFDGDGPLMGLVIQPLIVTAYFLVPLVAMGGVFGWVSSLIRPTGLTHQGS